MSLRQMIKAQNSKFILCNNQHKKSILIGIRIHVQRCPASVAAWTSRAAGCPESFDAIDVERFSAIIISACLFLQKTNNRFKLFSLNFLSNLP